MKCFLNIDRLEIAFLPTTEKAREILSNGLNYYGEMFAITTASPTTDNALYYNITLSNGMHFGEIVFGNKKFNKDKIYINVSNEILYTSYLYIVNEVAAILDLEIHSISRLDLAYDTNKNVIEKFYSILRNNEYDLKILNKIYGMNDEIGTLLHVSSGTRNNVRKNKSFYIKNIEGGLTLHCYNKSKEIEDNGNKKQYIKDVVNSNKIYRLEIRLEHFILNDTLKKIGFTDSYLYTILLNRDNAELFFLYQTLLDRIIEVKHKRKSISFLEFIN